MAESPTPSSPAQAPAALRVPHGDLREGRLTLPADAAHYVTRVHRLGQGAALLLFDVDSSAEADGVVESVGVSTGVVVRVGPVRPSSRVPLEHTVLLQAAGKGDKGERTLRDATALGATAVQFVVTERAERRSASDERMARWQRVVIEVARQCERGNVPLLGAPMPLAEAIASLPSREEVDDLRLLLLPEAATPLQHALSARSWMTPVVVLIGPEGGLSDEEVGAAVQAGFIPVRLGRFVLRTEEVAGAVLGALAAWRDAGG